MATTDSFAINSDIIFPLKYNNVSEVIDTIKKTRCIIVELKKSCVCLSEELKTKTFRQMAKEKCSCMEYCEECTTICLRHGKTRELYHNKYTVSILEKEIYHLDRLLKIKFKKQHDNTTLSLSNDKHRAIIEMTKIDNDNDLFSPKRSKRFKKKYSSI